MKQQTKCLHKNSGRSPTGWWCNDCGLMDPCPCAINDHLECIKEMNKLRKDGRISKTCCCEHEMNNNTICTQ